jgi:hypothetical protein
MDHNTKPVGHQNHDTYRTCNREKEYQQQTKDFEETSHLMPLDPHTKQRKEEQRQRRHDERKDVATICCRHHTVSYIIWRKQGSPGLHFRPTEIYHGDYNTFTFTHSKDIK